MVARLDGTVVYVWALLLACGVVFVCSVTFPMTGSWFNSLFLKHIAGVVLALVAFGVVSLIPLYLYERYYQIALLGAMAMTAIVLLPGIGSSEGGGRRWIDLGFFTFQVSEWVRVLLLIYLAGYLTAKQETVTRSFWVALLPLVFVGFVLFLVLLEPDYGTVVIVGTTAMVMLFIANVRLSHCIVIACSGLSLLAVLAVLKSYRVDRIVSFLDPWTSQLEDGYQLVNALIAFGNGGFFGLGLGGSVQKHFFIPAAHNDFILAVVAEEMGFVGIVILVALLFILIFKCLWIGRIALEERFRFGGLLAYGAGMLLCLQMLINIGVNVGVLPTKGLTLPFISYGGNSLLVCSILVALVCRVRYEFLRDVRR